MIINLISTISDLANTLLLSYPFVYCGPNLVEITDRNANKKGSRTTRRSARHIAMILPEDYLCLAESLAKAAVKAHYMGCYKALAMKLPSMEW